MNLIQLIQGNHLIGRIPKHHPLYDEIRRQEAGLAGENYAKHQLLKAGVPIVLTDIHLNKSQIDLLAITVAGILVCEVKNIHGDITLHHSPKQMRRGPHDNFTHPDIQLHDSIHELSKLVNVPLYGAIVFAFNQSRVTTHGADFPVLMARELGHFIRSLPSIVPTQKLPQLRATIQAAHQPMLDKLPLNPESIATGVVCPTCQQLAMQWQRTHWLCLHCQTESHHAHQTALATYKALFGEQLTNEQARQFLHISSRDTMRRLLQKEASANKANGRHTIYVLR